MSLTDDVIKDFLYAARTLRRSPIFTGTATITIALGIGASITVFSVIDALFLRPLPYKDPDRIVIVARDIPKRDARDYPVSTADFFDLQDQSKHVFEHLAGIVTSSATIALPGSQEPVMLASVTSEVFDVLRPRMATGRFFEPADGAPPPLPTENSQTLAPPQRLPTAVILSNSYWQKRFGTGVDRNSPNMPGMQVAGVLASDFELLLPPAWNMPQSPDVWLAARFRPDPTQREVGAFQMIARLKDGVSLAQAQAAVNVIAAKFESTFPLKAASGFALRLEPIQKYLVAEVRPAILALAIAVVFLLLIACANVANLLVVRTSLRERELAVRASMGGTLSRLVRQMMTEAVILAAIGTLLGTGLAWLGIRALQLSAAVNPSLARLPRLGSITIGTRALLFAVAAGLLAAILYGLIPALRASRPDLMKVLRASSRTPGLGGGARFRNGIVAFEIALSFVLLIGSGLMFRSFLALQRVDLGYEPSGVLTLKLNDGQVRRTGAFMREIRDRLSALPGIKGASRTFALPLSGTFSSLRWGTEESVNSAASFNELADTQFVLPGYFETMGARLIEGRTFTDADNKPPPFPIIIDSLLARKAFPNQPAVGKRIRMGSRPVEVIGVVEHQRISSLVEDGRPQMYFAPESRGYEASGFWVIRTAGDPTKYAAAVRAEIANINPGLKVTEVQPLQAYIDRAQSKTRFSLLLLSIFAAIAVLLAGIGLYGVLATLVRQRTPEIGVRMALGATPTQVFKLIVGRGMLLSAIGILAGMIGAFALTRLMVSLLVGVKASDPATFAVTAVLFLSVAMVASWLPARRAATLDPAVSLREE